VGGVVGEGRGRAADGGGLAGAGEEQIRLADEPSQGVVGVGGDAAVAVDGADEVVGGVEGRVGGDVLRPRGGAAPAQRVVGVGGGVALGALDARRAAGQVVAGQRHLRRLERRRVAARRRDARLAAEVVVGVGGGQPARLDLAGEVAGAVVLELGQQAVGGAQAPTLGWGGVGGGGGAGHHSC